MRSELSKLGKKRPRCRLPKFVNCPTFLTTRRIHWVLGCWHTSRSPAPWGTALPRAVNTRLTHVRSSGRCASRMRLYAASIASSHYCRSFLVQPTPFSGKKRTQFSKFEVVESKYRCFNRARWQLTAKNCDQKCLFGRNSTSQSRRKTNDIVL